MVLIKPFSLILSQHFFPWAPAFCFAGFFRLLTKANGPEKNRKPSQHSCVVHKQAIRSGYKTIFNKIFNVFCYKNKIPGEDASNITTGPCPYSFLIYNRKNFRDKDKPQGMTRQEYGKQVLTEIDREGVVATLLKKAKDSVKQKYQDSEITSTELGYIANSGVHIHHILPQHSYPEYSLARENLIALTPGQHLSFAHIRANTKSISPLFQAICLKTKLVNIEDGENFYNYNVFISIINTCYGWELNHSIDKNLLLEKIESKIQELS